jgi:phosphoglycolate phosphatase-like HAD superfamily hydrolase
MAKQTLYVFDFDDCIITNHSVDLNSFNVILRNHHLRVLSKRQLLRLRYRDLRADDIFRYVTRGPVKQLVRERRELLQSPEIWRHARLNTGARQALQTIASRNQRAVIATNKPETLVHSLLARLSISRHIEAVYTCHDKAALVRRLIKENPGIAFVFVSDSEEDLISVKTLAVKSYCMFNSYKNKSKMRAITKVVTSLEEVVCES